MFGRIAVLLVLAQFGNAVFLFVSVTTTKTTNKISISYPRCLNLIKDDNIITQNSKLQAATSKSESTLQPTVNSLDLFSSLLIFPSLFSFVIPLLINDITDYDISTFQRQIFIISLLLFKRIYLYSMSLVILDKASKRANQNYIPNLGERLLNINQELLPSSMLSISYEDVDDITVENESKGISGTSSVPQTKKAIISQETKEMYASIDNIDQNKLALILPIFLAISLAGSFYVLTHTPSLSGGIGATDNDSTMNYILNSDVVVALKGIFIKWLPFLANFGVCFLFVKSLLSNNTNNNQSQILSNESSKSTVNAIQSTTAPSAALISSILPILLLTIASFLVPPGGGSRSDVITQLAWPLHNFINACLCITVSRVLQLNSLSTVVLALIGLTAYDVLAVAGTQMYSDNGNSVMEAIATAKLGLSSSSSQTISSGVAGVTSNSVSNVLSTSIGSAAFAIDNVDSILLYIRNSLTNSLQSLSHVETLLDVFKWRPGLLEVSVQGRVSDALGLGDIVFPAILSSWVLRYETFRNNQKNEINSSDNSINSDNSKRLGIRNKEDEITPKKENDDYTLYKSTLGGYAIGCILCDVFMALGLSGTSGGQPALLFLVPSMLMALGAVSGARKEWIDMMKYNSNELIN